MASLQDNYFLSSPNRILYLLFLFAFTLRLAVGLYCYNTEVWKDFADDNARERFANSIVENGFVPESKNFKSPESIFAPLVPLIIAFKILIFGNTWLPIFILNGLIGAFSCLIIYLISLNFFSRNISLLAFAWASIYPNYIGYTGTAGNEPWVVFLFALTFLFAIKSIYSDKIKFNLVLFSLFFALLFHTDERYISYILFFSLILSIGRSPILIKIRKVAIFLIFTVLFSFPWLIRNHYYYEDIVLVSVRTIDITKHFSHPKRELMFFEHETNERYLSEEEIELVQKGQLDKYSNGMPIWERQIESMKAGNVPHKFTKTQEIVSRIHFLWMPIKFKDHYRIDGYNFKAAWSLRHNLMTGLSYGLLLPFMFLAFYHLIKRKKWEIVLLFGGVILYHTFIHVAFIPYTRDRYRHPIDFIIIILGIYGISILYEYFKNMSIRNKGMRIKN